MKNTASYIFLYGKEYRTITLGWQGAPYSGERYGRELVSKPTGDFVKEKFGGGGVP